MTRTILIATSNLGKRAEIEAVMKSLPVTWRTLRDFPELAPPVEDGDTFAANAALKARFYATRTGLWTLADDSGLEVDALDGAPGVHSARYAGGGDADNNRKLVRALQAIPHARRTARFVCALAVAEHDRVLATACGTIEGTVIDEPRGSNGFGYDPHFLVPHLGLTTAELPAEQKNAISHRGQALREITPRLLALLR